MTYKTVDNYIKIGCEYEKILSINNKKSKKDSGRYYTPKDVALIMSKWFSELDGLNICDVGCGTGNLILTYFDFIGDKQTKDVLKNNRLFLYDLDKEALNICKNLILEKYGYEYRQNIHLYGGDFLDKNIHLPNNCKVISNPPYSTIKEIKNNWNITDVIKETREYYSAFIEKIINESKSSVIISPYSFISGNKFYSLRKIFNKHNGFIISFDNVPGNIFKKKYGVFNSNTSNSVRASISVIKNKKNKCGFRISPLIRFKNEEREKLLKCDVLENTLGSKYQVLNDDNELNKMYYKCHKQLEKVFEVWKLKSSRTFKELLSKELSSNYILYFPNTCRYNTTCSVYNLKRSGKYQFNFSDEYIFYFCYCFLNSSFCYWFWRIYDGGITYQKRLLENIPIFYDILSNDDKIFFKDLAIKMINNENNYIVIKNNVGFQENIKFPEEYRNVINDRLLKILNIKNNDVDFSIIHNNRFFTNE